MFGKALFLLENLLCVAIMFSTNSFISRIQAEEAGSNQIGPERRQLFPFHGPADPQVRKKSYVGLGSSWISCFGWAVLCRTPRFLLLT